MSSSNRQNYLRCLLLGAVLILSGCQVRPLYATNPAGTSVANSLAEIEIGQATDRIGLELRNQLLFDLENGYETEAKTHFLSFTISSGTSDLGLEVGTGRPKASRVTVTVNYLLKHKDSGETVLKQSHSATASFDRSDQRFANLRAERDAQNRAATTLAQEIRLRLASYMSKR
ncbi:MAG: hypothetical protein JKY49_03985 [Cohaesibacteraceae bacterium]|nr:hypothetical protein [Cohaesibacteraceae bacterium]MBL4877018.1 hypothetical protein [Cohaesibacteraceae bacterium]